METILIRERYKVIRMLGNAPNCTFLEAVDILDREKCAYLLNVFEGELRQRYLPCFDYLKDWPSFVEQFMDGGKLILVFQECKGQPIDRVFYRGVNLPWRTRLTYADLLIQEALAMANLPPIVSCAAMLSENLLIDTNGETIQLQFKLVPLEDMNRRELALLTGDQLNKILLRQFTSPAALLDFLDLLDRGESESIIQLYALWKSWRGEVAEAFEEQERRNIVSRWVHIILTQLKRATGFGKKR